MKKAIFCTIEPKEIIAPFLKKNPKDELILVQLDAWVEPVVQENFLLKDYKSYLSFDDCVKIDKDALWLSQNWYIPEGEDFTVYNGYSLGELIRVPMFVLFIAVFKHILLMRRVIEQEGCDELIVVDDRSVISKILIATAMQSGVRSSAVDAPECKKERRRSLATMKFEKKALSDMKFFIQDIIWSLINKWPWFGRGKQSPKRLKIFFDPYVGYYTMIEGLFKGRDYDVLLPRPKLFDFSRIGFLKLVFKNRVSFCALDNRLNQIPKTVFQNAELFPPECWNKVKDRQSFIQQFRWRDIDFWPAIREELRDNYFIQFSSLIKELSLAENFLVKHRVDMVIVPWDDGILYKSFVTAAKKLGIETQRYQHGVGIDFPHLPMPRSDKILIWGEKGRDFYLKRGLSPSRLELCGNPVKTLLEKKRSVLDKTLLCHKLGLDPRKKIILYADVDFEGITALDHPYDAIRNLVKLISAAKELYDVQFLVKFHHGDGNYVKKVELINRTHIPNVHDCYDFNIYDLVLISDIVITEYSTVGFEALLAGKAVIIFKLRGGYTDIICPYNENSGVVIVSRESEIVPAIKRIFNDKELCRRLSAKSKEFIAYAAGPRIEY